MRLFFTEEKIDKLLFDVKPTIYRETVVIPSFKFIEGDPQGAQFPDFDDSSWANFNLMDYWGGYDKIVWHRARVEIPPHFRNQKLSFKFLLGPRDGGGSTAETMLYLNGEPVQGIDIWHEDAWLPPEHVGESVFVALRSWSGVLDVPDRRRFKVAQLNLIDEETEAFYYLAENLNTAVKTMDKNDWRREKVLRALNYSFQYINFTRLRSDEYYASIERARAYLAGELEKLYQIEDPTQKPKVIGVGHSHIDLAWLWRWSHSREKAGRTFSTVLHLMRQYPEYRFMHSSPSLYKALSEDYLDIFQKVSAKIESGEWEITGGMWVEPDTNVPSGESLIRQILYGKRYIRETFGKETNVVWLPDVFGYSWALPQIIIKSGMKYFMTTKISWSQFNRFPYDTFYWRGIDGTQILTHFITTPEEGAWFYTYNGKLDAKDVIGIWENYQSKDVNDELLLAFGWGDGGGGPTREMLESARVMKNLPGFPSVEIGHAEPYFARLEARTKEKILPIWDGELYLEYHRGTYTSQAQNKRANRKSEILYHDAEFIGTLATLLTGNDVYPDLTEGWELILFNQFHDILPGSSIRQVYEDSAIDYARVAEIGAAALEASLGQVAANIRTEGDSVVVFNTLPDRPSALIELPYSDLLVGKSLYNELTGLTELSQMIEENGQQKLLVELSSGTPVQGYRTYTLATATPWEYQEFIIEPTRLENAYYRITLNERGQITSILDKRYEVPREILAPDLANNDVKGMRGNVFQAFEDKPLRFDAWDIDIFYQAKMQEVDNLVEAVVEETGPVRGTLRLVWRFYDSTITQRISLYNVSRRIDFRTEVDWKEGQVLLKVAFPVNVRNNRATYNIQFGSIERPTHWNTSWDFARFEVPAQKWADLSESNYGVALLNESKYGYDIKDNVMRLTLIKSSVRPDALADKMLHSFTYSLLPHTSSLQESEVVHEGYNLNYPLHAVLVPAQPNGTLAPEYTFATTNRSHEVIVETVKRAEDGNGWIVRVYEAQHSRHQRVELAFGQPISRTVECNLVEEGESPVEIVDGNKITFPITPYEIKTFRLWF
jgi:alpha-mannosidase